MDLLTVIPFKAPLQSACKVRLIHHVVIVFFPFSSMIGSTITFHPFYFPSILIVPSKGYVQSNEQS